MGSVWEAEDLRLDRRVAVKLPAEELTRGIPDLLERFAREATAAGRLAHPNVATVHDHDHDGGTPFIVMEMLRGETLGERIRRGPLPEDEAVQIAGQVAAALDAAHDAGIVHRDVKPANIMLTAGGVKVMDFGVATAEWTHTITTAGVLGTAAYLSPEQARGESAVPASDVYALGVVVYEMLAGRPPFVADTLVAVVAAHVHRDPPPLAELAPAASDHAVRAVALALDKDPSARPATPSAFARMLEGRDDTTLPQPVPVAAATDDVERPADLAPTEPVDDREPTAVLAAPMPPADARPRRGWWMGAVAAGLVVVALATWAWADDDVLDDTPAATTVATASNSEEPTVEPATTVPPTVAEGTSVGDGGADEGDGGGGNGGGNGNSGGNGNAGGNGNGRGP
jgi:serine/threonine-protein kinase